MKKVVAFIGSPRKGGNSDILTREVLEGARSEGAQVSFFYLNDLNIKGCQGCRACKKSGKCVLKDDMTPLYQEIKSADGIVISSPIYFAGISGQTKIFLDRWYAFITRHYTSRLRGNKKGVFILCQGRNETERYLGVAKKYEMILQYSLGLKKVVFLRAIGVPKKGQVANNKKLLSDAFTLGIFLVKSKK